MLRPAKPLVTRGLIERPMETKQAIGALSALAQETRLAIFRMLVQKGPQGMSAGAIAEALGVPASSLSFHLAHLSRAGLVAPRRASRLLIYSAGFAAMNSLMAYLTENCCGGGATTCTPVCDPAGAVAQQDESPEAPSRSRGR